MGNPYAPPEPGRPLPDRPAGPPSSRPDQPDGPDRSGPQPPPADPEQLRDLARRVLRFSLLMLGGVLALQLPVPWQASGILLTGAGLVVGAGALRRALRARVRTALVVSVVVGLAMGGLVLVLHLAMLAVWPAALELQECRARALTVSAEDECQAQYEEWLLERSGLPEPQG